MIVILKLAAYFVLASAASQDVLRQACEHSLSSDQVPWACYRLQKNHFEVWESLGRSAKQLSQSCLDSVRKRSGSQLLRLGTAELAWLPKDCLVKVQEKIRIHEYKSLDF